MKHLLLAIVLMLGSSVAFAGEMCNLSESELGYCCDVSAKGVLLRLKTLKTDHNLTSLEIQTIANHGEELGVCLTQARILNK